MCAPHAERAGAVVEDRLQRAWDSNPDGMDAIMGTSDLLTEPTYGLSLALLRALDDVARRDPFGALSAAELAADAQPATRSGRGRGRGRAPRRGRGRGRLRRVVARSRVNRRTCVLFGHVRGTSMPAMEGSPRSCPNVGRKLGDPLDRGP